MNAHYSRLTRIVLLFLAGMMASLVWASAFAQAFPPRIFSRPVTNLVVPITGSVQTDVETIVFSGLARVKSTVVTDPDFGGPPGVILSVDLLNVFGKGQTTRARYVARGEDKVIRLFGDTDLVEVTFPVFPIGSTTPLATPLVASLNLNFDVGNGQLRRAIARFLTPNLPGLGLGRFAP